MGRRSQILLIMAFVLPGFVGEPAVSHAAALHSSDWVVDALQAQTADQRRDFLGGLAEGLNGRVGSDTDSTFRADGRRLGSRVRSGEASLSPRAAGTVVGAYQRFLDERGRGELRPNANGSTIPSSARPVPREENQPQPNPAPETETEKENENDNENETRSERRDDNDDDDDDDDNAIWMILGALGLLAGLGLLLASLNNDDDQEAFTDGYGNGYGLPTGQDNWTPQAGPHSSPSTWTPRSTTSPYSNWPSARNAWERESRAQAARARCVEELSLMIDGMNDLAGGLALQAAESGVVFGQNAQMVTAQQLLQRAEAKLQCGAARLQRGAYALPGHANAICESLKQPLSQLPVNISYRDLPRRWKLVLDDLGVSHDMMEEVLQVLRCRANGGTCAMDWSIDSERRTRVTSKTDVRYKLAEVCGGTAEGLADQIGRPFGLGPPFQSPLETCKTSPYGWRASRGAMHHGTDLRGQFGTPFRSIAPGNVIHAGPKGGYGNTIVVEHDDGSQSLYGHIIDGGIRVQPGQRVDWNTSIGQVGSTGNSTGPHLHLEIRRPSRDGRLVEVNPEEVLGRYASCWR